MATTGILIISPSTYPGSGAPLDLSNYMRVNQGDGLDPANPTFTNKVWARSLLKEGGVQALESLQLKEMQFPLYLSATTRDGVAALVQQVNAMINAPGQTVGWQDQGASNMTFYDLASGQFDIHYDFRRAGGNAIIDGLLRLFVQPLGHTATMRLVASAAGTGPLLTLPIPSPILGDAPALIRAQVQGGSAALQRNVAVSVLQPNYQALYPAPTLPGAGANATFTGGSGAVASQFVRFFAGPGVGVPGPQFAGTGAFAQIPATTAYFGQNRVFAIARTSAASAVIVLNQYSNVGWSTFAFPVLASNATSNPLVGTDWQAVDLGIVSIPSSANAISQVVDLTPYGYMPSNAATRTLDVSALVVLPDTQTSYINESAMGASNYSLPRTFDLFDAITGETWGGATTGWASAPAPNMHLTPAQRGQIPKLQPALAGPIGASQQIAVFAMGATPLSSIGSSVQPANELISGAVWVRERFRFDQG